MSPRLNDQGALVSSDLYGAYGSLKDGNPINNPVGYCDQCGCYADYATGYILCTYRWYDPLTARWLTRNVLPLRRVPTWSLYCKCHAEQPRRVSRHH